MAKLKRFLITESKPKIKLIINNSKYRFYDWYLNNDRLLHSDIKKFRELGFRTKVFSIQRNNEIYKALYNEYY